MKAIYINTVVVSILLFCLACKTTKIERSEKPLSKLHLVTPFNPDSSINVLVEITAGTTAKWELNKQSGKLEIDKIDGRPRYINYVGYPANYGMIPNTLSPLDKGGDGDPIDVIVLGDPIERGSLVKCKVVGVLMLLDKGEKDDKLIAISHTSQLAQANDLSSLQALYPGVTTILETWFTNYKGPGQMTLKGFHSRSKAMQLINEAIDNI